jgi:membrane-bound lytic murein transglycosylase D
MVIMSKNAEEYGIQNLSYEPAVQYESLELQTPTHIGLVAAALDRSVSELKELNPSLVRSVTPAGFTLRVPKGSLAQLEAALRVIPADRRDSWRVHRVEPGDTFAAVAKRYGTSPDVLSSANHDQLPETGSFAAVPVAYPGDAKPAKVASRKSTAKPATKKTSAKTVASTPASRKPATKSNAKSAAKATPKPSASVTGKAVRSPGKRTSGA